MFHPQKASTCDSLVLVVTVISRTCKVSRSSYQFRGKKVAFSLVFYRARAGYCLAPGERAALVSQSRKLYQVDIVKSVTSVTIVPSDLRFDVRPTTVQLRSPLQLTMAGSLYPSLLYSNDGILPLALKNRLKYATDQARYDTAVAVASA